MLSFYPQKAKTAELYAVCCVDQLRAPGRQFDGLLAGFQPCPEVLVYTGSCQSGSFSESTRTDYVLAAAGSASEYDLSTEALHAIELCRLNDRDVDFMATVSLIISLKRDGFSSPYQLQSPPPPPQNLNYTKRDGFSSPYQLQFPPPPPEFELHEEGWVLIPLPASVPPPPPLPPQNLNYTSPLAHVVLASDRIF